MKHARILVVDDERSIREILSVVLREEGYEVDTAVNGRQAWGLFQKQSYDMVVSDLKMPEMDGLELLSKVKSVQPGVVFLMVTAFSTADTAVEAMRLGAYDYLSKPFKLDEVRLNVSNALNSRALQVENQQLKKQLGKKHQFKNLVGNSIVMRDMFDLIKRAARTPTSILIQGESGTGKECVAKAVHYNSDRKSKSFVPINCGAIPETLIESELFGHKKGSFTGAVADKKGVFEAADGGTLFLDEVGDLPLSMQVKLLRAIQERQVRPVGSPKSFSVDVRLVSASNASLHDMVEAGEFRADLYYRLNVIRVEVPALRDRGEDVPLLAEHFLKKYNAKMGRDIKSISAEAMEFLKNYRYPGNVRELENIIERAVALEPGGCLLPESFEHGLISTHRPKSVTELKIQAPLPEGGAADFDNASTAAHASTLSADKGDAGAGASHAQATLKQGESVDLDQIMESVEKSLLVQALERTQGVQRRAARLLKINARSMRYRMAKYNLKETG